MSRSILMQIRTLSPLSAGFIPKPKNWAFSYVPANRYVPCCDSFAMVMLLSWSSKYPGATRTSRHFWASSGSSCFCPSQAPVGCHEVYFFECGEFRAF
jgi:hypothetical protein